MRVMHFFSALRIIKQKQKQKLAHPNRVEVTQPPYALLPCLCTWEACVKPRGLKCAAEGRERV